jgi:transcriptional regulator with XRE-family HTH domain
MLDMGFATEQEVRSELGKRLRCKRIALDLPQAALAAKSGVSISTIKLIESKGQSTLENLVKVLIALGLVGELQNLFVYKPISIAMMERMNATPRQRAPRRAKNVSSANSAA